MIFLFSFLNMIFVFSQFYCQNLDRETHLTLNLSLMTSFLLPLWLNKEVLISKEKTNKNILYTNFLLLNRGNPPNDNLIPSDRFPSHAKRRRTLPKNTQNLYREMKRVQFCGSKNCPLLVIWRSNKPHAPLPLALYR